MKQKLIIIDIIRPVEYNKTRSELGELMEYITASQTAKKWGISQRRIQKLCAEDRILGAFKLGENWAIPVNATKPLDKRRRMRHEKTL